MELRTLTIKQVKSVGISASFTWKCILFCFGTAPEFLSYIITKNFTCLACNPQIRLVGGGETVSDSVRVLAVSVIVPYIGHPGSADCDSLSCRLHSRLGSQSPRFHQQ